MKSNNRLLAYGLIAPTALVLIVLVAYPVLYNFVISFQDVSLNLNKASEFVGLENYIAVLTDPEFYKSLLTTVLYTIAVVGLSTALGLFVAILFNKKFRFKKLANAMIILSYIVPSIASVYVWKYMFNVQYGVINYLFVDVFNLSSEAPLWFDEPILSFVLVVLFAVWRYFPYAYMAFYAILKTIDSSQYEAAHIDGATRWQRFRYITLPGVKPVLITVIVLRSIWTFYMYTDIVLLTNQVETLGKYMYDQAFIFNELGIGAAISIIMFLLIFPFIKIIQRGDKNVGK